MAVFGSVGWQEEMLRRVQVKIVTKRPLDGEEKAFLEVQSDKLLREGKLTKSQYNKLKKLW